MNKFPKLVIRMHFVVMSKRGSYCTQIFCKGRDLLDSELFSFDPNKTTHKLTTTTTAKWRRSTNKGYLSSFNHCFQPAQGFRSVGGNDRIKYYLLSNITLEAESSPIFLRNIEEDSARTCKMQIIRSEPTVSASCC